jgi:ribonuclease-3
MCGVRCVKRLDRLGERLDAALSELESQLGHSFVARGLLVRALTHRSLSHSLASVTASAPTASALTASTKDGKISPGDGDRTPGATKSGDGLREGDSPSGGDNERLEFLGDAVLGLVVAEALYGAHPEWDEGELTRVRAQLVSRKHMAEVAKELKLGRHLRLSRGEERSGLRNTATLLSNSMEAVLGALFLDGGLEPVRSFARTYVIGQAAEQLAEELRSGAALGNFKSALQEYLQSTHVGTPEYRVKSEMGPDHRKKFLVEVCLSADGGGPGQVLASGKGSTKKHAEQNAAQSALQRLHAREIIIESAEGKGDEAAAE